jgi:nitroreductase
MFNRSSAKIMKILIFADMADNYLEKRQEELARSQKKVVKRSAPSLDTLLHRNRSYRGYDPSRAVSEEELRALLSVVPLTASGMNRQPLRFRLVTAEKAGLVLPHITLGAALPEEHLPKPGMEPEAFIVVCSAVPEDKVVDIDLGIAAQSILLKAVERGLGGIFILNFRKEALREALQLPSAPLAVIAIGKPAESIYLMPVSSPDQSLSYYRKDGVHYVPKLQVDMLLI